MLGVLVINQGLTSEKFNTLHSHLQKTAGDMGIDLEIKTNFDMQFYTEKPDFVLFWDKDVALARLLEARGIPVFNSSEAIRLCDDKGDTYLSLLNKVKQPKTIIAPLSFFNTDFSTFVATAVEKLGLPIVLKKRKGSFGEQVYLCHSEKEVLEHITDSEFLLQEYIECGNSDLRLEVVGGKVVCAMKRTNEKDFRSNITNGGTAEIYQATEEEKTLAIKACDILGLDFGGVDIIGGDMVCEVNSNAHIINIMQATGIDVAKAIFEYILNKIHKPILVYSKEEAVRNRFVVNAFAQQLGTVCVTPDYRGAASFVVNRSNDYKIAEHYENRGVKVFNGARFTKIANDKQLCYDFIEQQGLECLPTRYKQVPFVKKPKNSHGGNGVVICNDIEEYDENMVCQMPASDVGKDLRIYVLDGEIVTAILRTNSKDFRSNYCLGGNAEEYHLTKEEKAYIKPYIDLAVGLGGIYFGADFLFHNGKLIFNEYEDAVGARMVYDITDIDIIKDYISVLKAKK